MKIIKNKPVERKQRMSARRREAPLRVERKADVEPNHIGKLEVRGSYDASVTTLVEFWDREYERATSLPDESLTWDQKCTRMGNILGEVGDGGTVERLVLALLTDKRADWINNKTLVWLDSKRNRTFLAPMLIRQKTRTAEYQGKREEKLQFKFRK